MARRAGDVAASSWARASPRTAKLPQLPTDNSCREELVHTVLRLLLLKGHRAEQELLGRIEAGQGVTARGFHFDPSVLQEALRQWSTQREIDTSRMEEPGCTAGSMSTVASADASRFPKRRRCSIRFDHRGAEPPASPSRCSQSCARRGGDAQQAVNSKAASGSNADSMPAATSPSVASTPTPARVRRKLFMTASPTPTSLDAASSSRSTSKPPTMKSGKPQKKRPMDSPDASPKRSDELPNAGPGPGAEQQQEQPALAKGRSIKELKAMLQAAGLDAAACVEKNELEVVCRRLTLMRSWPLEAPANPASPQSAATPMAATPTAMSKITISHSPRTEVQTRLEAADREGEARREAERITIRNVYQAEARREAERILPLVQRRFPTPDAWGFAVLDVASRDVASVQRGYRMLMRKLHPDKAGSDPSIVEAAEIIRKARDACERGLSRQERPGAPRNLRSVVLCGTPGQRKFRLDWTAPLEEQDAGPVRRYVVAAVDPAYGRALTFAVLEPDYREELRRFVSVDELTSYVLAEEELQKMPSVWRQSYATVQVAAANEVGQSSWSVHRIPLDVGAKPVPLLERLGSFAANLGLRTESTSPGSKTTGPSPGPKVGHRQESEDAVFLQELPKTQGPELRAWLERQRKAELASWLRSVRWPATGAKPDLVARIMYVREGHQA